MTPDSLHIPPFLRRGDCIGLFSPSGPLRDHDRLDKGISILRDLGFTVRPPLLPPKQHEYLAADDHDRARAFHALLDDEQVDALMAVRGGYGCQRMLPLIDLELVRARPKLIIGFSDLTILLNTTAARSRVPAVHGPVVTTLCDCDRETIQAFTAMLSGSLDSYSAPRGLEVLRPGTATGVLAGGNLTSLAHLLATPWDIDWQDTVLFLEDTGEPMYRVDRMLTQLSQAGKLDKLAGLVLGSFGLGRDGAENLRLQEQIWYRVLELTEESGYPVWGGFPVGHLPRNYPLPLGARATMDGSSGRLQWQLR